VIKVNCGYAVAGGGERDGGVDSGGRLPRAALFIRENNEMCFVNGHCCALTLDSPTAPCLGSCHLLIGAGPSVQIITSLAELRDRTRLIRNDGGIIALVPTMGALHAGHMGLVRLARQRADHVIVSIFVNPKQFGVGEDLARYPRREEEDVALLTAEDVTALWMPSVGEMYPEGFATTVSVASLGDRLCGASRPGHFDGVATVVAKLFNQVRPDVAIFGEKDWQQLAVIRRMAADLDLGVEVIGMPTEREADGLALSSRNAYLNADERKAAVALPQALCAAVAEIEGGAPIEAALNSVRAKLTAAGFGSIDYVELVNATTLNPLTSLDCSARILAAARIGSTRLIDNFPVSPKEQQKK
jgi:pantoate--beta-alanine ligase